MPSDQIRSALFPKFGDEFDRIFQTKQLELFAEGALVQCETC